ncbi:tRNA (adenosine(37)-N6)-threonylcarbamoyltransferase complex dimerization subunit type 1 TsaB [Jiella sonneratiae]|uniref:tRNA (Adenosine(37)-N6)-threonylcarbamoyltransferase complex dimerization subunit type 1 TsaB n=1 Tax=Jiella sonneratiae TaxID=2816856 RepID=A0ABS3J213_9HYPH|nr:tRNA (adenosine(37)-N6)-threonylcarbamoyltransferase complex dimerization subunit type 1 TsaB [Jiella sonneratiae]MBO0903693.1 tRNA (adenosine(37)-N6)-threonylcarbamoyltransferase complex dimerization subunit type 1 TsaB [Jiella sonneratiae]
MPPLILAIDTAFTRCTAAIFDPAGAGRLLAAAEPEIGKGHAERLTGVIAEVLDAAGARYGDLTRIVVATGPGSFTGIRVGVAAARGLALALDVPAVGVSTLAALAHGAVFRNESRAADEGEEEGATASPILAVLDARRGEVYAGLFAADGGPLASPAALAPAALQAFLADAGAWPGPLRLVGSGAPIAASHLAGGQAILLDDRDRIDPEALARLGAAGAAETPPRPVYLRSADAKPSSLPSLRRDATESFP